MAYEKINDLSTDTVFKLGGMDNKTGKPCPKQIEGFYLGSRPVQTSGGPAVIHVFQTSKGNEGIWGTKKLNDNLTRNIVGCMVNVVYKGKKKLTGGKTQHEYDMFVDRSVRTVVEDVGSTDTGYEDDYTGSSYEDNGEDTDVQLPLRKSTSAAEVEALLKGSGSRKN